MFDNHERAADAFAEWLGLSQALHDSVAQTFERWAAWGVPGGLRGDELPIATRLVSRPDDNRANPLATFGKQPG